MKANVCGVWESGIAIHLDLSVTGTRVRVSISVKAKDGWGHQRGEEGSFYIFREEKGMIVLG